MTIQGGNLAGATHGLLLAGSQSDTGGRGGQIAGSHPREAGDVEDRGIGHSGRVGSLYASDETGVWSGTYGSSSRSVDDLLDVSGFALVLRRADGQKRQYAIDNPQRSLVSLQITNEVNTKSSWQVDVPPDPDLYEWPFADAIIGHEGDRLFHGILLPVESAYRDSMTLSGYGPLWHATYGKLSVTYPGDHPDFESDQDIPAWRAINDVWNRATDATSGKVRGSAVQPLPRNERVIPSSGESWEGTPLEVLQKLHSYAGMAFAIDHSDPSGYATSFVPGEETRAGQWQSTDYNVAIDPEEYANRVVVEGAQAPDSYPYDRFRGVAEATVHEIDEVTDGRIIEHWEPAHDLSSELACEEQARSKLDELRGNYTITGSVDVTPTDVTPGYTYRVHEFEQAAPDVFTPVRLPLQSVEHSYGRTEAATSLQFRSPEGVEREIRDRLLPEGVSLDVARQDATFTE